MSFLDRTRQAAEKARQAAAERAHQAQIKIHEQAPIIQAQTREGFGIAQQNIKVGAKQAKKSAASIMDRIDPGILADLVIKATALQEKANASLRAKGSPYRIGEITLTAALPPQVGFTIARIGDIEEELTGREIESAELATSVATEEFSLVPTDADGQPIEIDPAAADAADAMEAWVPAEGDALGAASLEGGEPAAAVEGDEPSDAVGEPAAAVDGGRATAVEVGEPAAAVDGDGDPARPFAQEPAD
jgi:hypothetical protein